MSHQERTNAAAGRPASGRPVLGPDRLGPLVRVGGRWLVGDHEGPTHLEFTPEGVVTYTSEPGSESGSGPGPESGGTVPWSRFMDLGLAVTPTRLGGSRKVAVLTLGHIAPLGLTGPHLRATVRHPYEYWTGRFSHHDGVRYSHAEIAVANDLLGQAVDAGQARLLGDPAWLAEAVRTLTPALPDGRYSALTGRALREVRARITKLVAAGAAGIPFGP